MELWCKETEVDFFTKSNGFSNPEQLFYHSDDGHWYAYWPKNYKGEKTTLQSRNALIGAFTEKWSSDILRRFAHSRGWYSVQGVICEEIGLVRQSPADLAFCVTQQINQPARNIKALFEVKMSVVWNWELKGNKIICLGDYTSHKGTPGLLRSDSMLKAIGKSINIRVSGHSAAKIPIIILGNTPISEMYFSKVDHLKKSGIIQAFWSLNPDPRDGILTKKTTPENGFIKMDNYEELITCLEELFTEELEFFSSMKSKSELGKIIEIANQEEAYESKAQKFLELIRD